jgi:uncharacterized protein YjbJ (UPF0337 family)
MGSTTDKISGVANQAAGKAKETAGKVTGSEELQAEGLAQKAKGKAKKLAGDAKQAVKNATNNVADAANKKLWLADIETRAEERKHLGKFAARCSILGSLQEGSAVSGASRRHPTDDQISRLRLGQERTSNHAPLSGSVPKERQENDDWDRYTQQPKQNSSTHDGL